MVTFSGLYFDPSVLIKIRYEIPYRDIFYDLDGTLTGLGPKTWATPYWKHNEQPGCKVDLDVYDGLLCDSTVQVRRIAFYKYVPDIFFIMDLRILKIDDSIVGSMDNATKSAYYKNTSSYSIVPFRPKLDPTNGWAMPFVTGHKYKLHWRYGLDFTEMRIDLSPHWKTDDKDLYIVHNFTDVRA